MGILKEFQEFAIKGNVLDMAVGIIIGGAFGKVVTSLVNDVIMPPIGTLVGNVDFSGLSFPLRKASEGKAEVLLRYGAFINTLVDFVIVAAAIFMVVKAMNTLRRKNAEKPAEPPAPTTQEKLLMEIRDLLKTQA